MNFPSVRFEPKLKKTLHHTFAYSEKGARKLCNRLQLLNMVSILVPEMDTSCLEECLNYTYYTIAEFKLADALSKSAIEGYINNGDFVAISSGANECYQFLIVDKKLSLTLDRDIFFALNAVHLSKCRVGNDSQAFSFEVDLLAANDDIAKVVRELENEIFNKAKIDFMWKPQSDDTCPSSIAKFFANMGYAVSAVSNQSTNSFLFNLKFPTLPAENEDYEWDELIECVGMMMLGCDFEENICSSYQMPLESMEIGRGQALHFKGFIPHFILADIFKELSKSLKNNPHLPYLAISTVPASASLQKNCSSKSIILSAKTIHLVE